MVKIKSKQNKSRKLRYPTQYGAKSQRILDQYKKKKRLFAKRKNHEYILYYENDTSMPNNHSD